MKFYTGAARAARAYVERDRSRADDYYLAEGTGVAGRLAATPEGVTRIGSLSGDSYEAWVAGFDPDTGAPKGRLRTDEDALRFVEVVVNGPKTWSLAAALHPEVSAALDRAQDQAAGEIVGWLAAHATTRVGPRGRQVQVPVERVEAAVVRHYTSRAGDPHRHLHLQVNARVWATSDTGGATGGPSGGRWRGLHSVGVRDSIEAINGIGHAAVATNPGFRAALARYGYTIDPDTSEIRQLAPFVGAFSARTAQIRRNVDRYEAAWRSDHRGEEPGPRLREVWDRRAWAEARPDKVVPTDGRELVARWNTELRELGYRDPVRQAVVEWVQAGQINRDGAANWVISRLGAKRSAWNAADVRGGVEVLLAESNLVAEPCVRVELAEDITARAVARCVPLLNSEGLPEHVRALTSEHVVAVEDEIVHRLAARGERPAKQARTPGRGLVRIDPHQAAVVATLAGDGGLVVVEGAAGAGKTSTLRMCREALASQGHRLLVVTPTLKAAEVAAAETGAEGHSAAWLVYQHGWRWDADGHWARKPDAAPPSEAQLRPGDLLLVDETGMLDQDAARALLTIADETGARVALVGDRHQLPAVGRGGLLDHAVAFAHPTAVARLEMVHRFTDPDYARISLQMRTSVDPAAIFDTLQDRGHIVVHPSDIDRETALAEVGAHGDLVVADTHEQVKSLNAAIRDHRPDTVDQAGSWVTSSGEVIGVGDRVATRRNDPALAVANRQTWTVTAIGTDGSLTLRSKGHDRLVPPEYAAQSVELAYATTIHGAQGETVDRAHVAITPTTSAAAAYVAMTRGRHHNTAHLVAENLDDARRQWVEVFNRDRADLGHAHARRQAIEAIDRYGPQRSRQVVENEDRRQTPRAAAHDMRGVGL